MGGTLQKAIKAFLSAIDSAKLEVDCEAVRALDGRLNEE